MPRMYGYKSVKWVTRIEVQTHRSRRVLGAARLRRGRLGRRLQRAVSGERRSRRFGRTERALHWVHATGFLAMLTTGLVLYLPALSKLDRPAEPRQEPPSLLGGRLGDRDPAGHRRRRPAPAAADWREIETIDADDRRWLPAARAAGALQRGAEAQRPSHGRVRAALRRFRLLPLARRARPPLPLRRHRHRPRDPHAASVGLLAGTSTLRVIHPSTRHALRGHRHRRRPRGLGAGAPRQVERGRARAITRPCRRTATSSPTSSPTPP